MSEFDHMVTEQTLLSPPLSVFILSFNLFGIKIGHFLCVTTACFLIFFISRIVFYILHAQILSLVLNLDKL